MSDTRSVSARPCSGCGVCAGICPESRITMTFDTARGTYRPERRTEDCESHCGACDAVCPFSHGLSAPALNEQLYGQSEPSSFDSVLGHHLGCYAGYSGRFRLSSASGGLATWVCAQLLSREMVDGVVCVTPDEKAPTRFRFTIARDIEQLRAASGSCYVPVHAADVLKEVRKTDGRFALMGLPCLANAIRLAQRLQPSLRERLRYVLSLACGGPRTTHFFEYVSKVFMKARAPDRMEFRAKWPDREARQRYRFQYRSPDGSVIERRAVLDSGIGNAFGSSLFAAECRAECDDLFALTADAVFMDAWLPHYSSDWRGHSFVVTRHPEIDEILRTGASHGEPIEHIPAEQVKRSQLALLQERYTRRCQGATPSNGYRPGLLDRLSVRLQDSIRAAGWRSLERTSSYDAVHSDVRPLTAAWRVCNFVRRRMPQVRK